MDKIALVFCLFVSLSANSMEYVEICKEKDQCKKFSRLVMGTDHLIQGGWVSPGWPEYSDTKAFEVLDHAASLGINFFDTSPIYVGSVENRLGKWKEKRKQKFPEQEIHILSKGGFPFDLYWSQKSPTGKNSLEIEEALSSFEPGQFPPGTYASRLFGSTEQISERVAEELGHTINNLNGDITIYLMHRDDGDAVGFAEVPRDKTPVEKIMEALSSEGIRDKVWMLGWSNWETPRVEKSLQVKEKSPELIRPVINSPYFSLFEMSQRTIHALGVQVTHKEMMDPEFQKGIKIMPYSPLGGFSIIDKPEPQWENAKANAKEKHDRGDPYWQNVYHSIFTEENEKRWYRVLEFTKKFNKVNKSSYTVDQMINAYALAHPRVDMLAIGPITKEQLDRTVESLKLSTILSKQDLEYLHSGSRSIH